MRRRKLIKWHRHDGAWCDGKRLLTGEALREATLADAANKHEIEQSNVTQAHHHTLSQKVLERGAEEPRLLETYRNNRAGYRPPSSMGRGEASRKAHEEATMCHVYVVAGGTLPVNKGTPACAG